jgi:coniferyl-aldehyde dehydrogenase
MNILQELLERQQSAFNDNPYPIYEERLLNLNKLKNMLLTNQQKLIEALNNDFGIRSVDESKIGDLLTSVSSINYSMSKLKGWMKPKKRHVSVLFQPAKAYVKYQPVGVVGIMVPWNYPVFLAIGPLATALAAGNRAMIKMSEFTPHTSALLNELIKENFDDSLISIVEGEASVAQVFSSLKFNHLFFTGSTAVGRYVMRAAAENLVPVTLELGGKSPAIIDNSIDLKVAVERLIMGKTMNAGQTCVAPDYILCPRGKSSLLVKEFKLLFNKMYPSVVDNQDYTSVVSDGQYARLISTLEDAKLKGAQITPLVSDGNCERTRQLPLTLLQNVNDDMLVMQQEVFGPLLPIVEYDSIDEAIKMINNKERPLALYICSFEKSFQQQLIKNTHSGGVCINEASFHVAVDDLPFGGIGASGMGNYHGEEGFKTFSHAKAVLVRGRISAAKLLFPPYNSKIHQLVYKLFIR